MHGQLGDLTTLLALFSLKWVLKDPCLCLGPWEDGVGTGSHSVWTNLTSMVSANVIAGQQSTRWDGKSKQKNRTLLASACLLGRVETQASLWHQSCLGWVDQFTFSDVISHALVNSHRHVLITDACNRFFLYLRLHVLLFKKIAFLQTFCQSWSMNTL